MLAGGKKVPLEAGRDIVLHTDEAFRPKGTAEAIFVDYPDLADALRAGIDAPGGPRDIFIDDGLIRLEAAEIIDAKSVRCVVRAGGLLGERKGINIPGADLKLPAITEYDKSVLRWAVEQQADAVFASFIESADDVQGLRKFIQSVEAESGGGAVPMLIFSKIESKLGVDNLHEILEESDGILVARGDLGIEVPVEDVPWMQKLMIGACNAAGKPVICATQMLDSMEKSPRPTRAEASDVANAIIDGADVVMLSGETANGAHPDLVVETMARIARRTEEKFAHGMGLVPTDAEEDWGLENAGAFDRARTAMVEAAGDGSLLILPAVTGGFASEVAKLRPDAVMLAPTTSRRVANRMLMRRGLRPLLLCEDAVSRRCGGNSSKAALETAMAEMAFEWARAKGMTADATDAIAVVATEDSVPRLMHLR